MPYRLDQTCKDAAGVRDAIHVPFVVVQQRGCNVLQPGDWVKFVNDDLTTVEPCSKKEAHGIVNPFIDKILAFNNIVILLVPGITTPVRHHFDIDTNMASFENSVLERELEQAKKEDPNCAECYVIVNKNVERM